MSKPDIFDYVVGVALMVGLAICAVLVVQTLVVAAHENVPADAGVETIEGGRAHVG